jgi:hypothetical protein
MLCIAFKLLFNNSVLLKLLFQLQVYTCTVLGIFFLLRYSAAMLYIFFAIKQKSQIPFFY